MRRVSHVQLSAGTCRIFHAGEDLVLYDSVDDLIQKIDYYLSHEEERLQIAKNGYEKVKRYHTYDTRLTEILNTVISD